MDKQDKFLSWLEKEVEKLRGELNGSYGSFARWQIAVGILGKYKEVKGEETGNAGTHEETVSGDRPSAST